MVCLSALRESSMLNQTDVKPMKFCLNRQTFYSVINGLLLVLTVWGCGLSDTKTNSTPTHTPTNQSETKTTPTPKKKIVLFYGNSLTAGYGVEPAQAFPALIGQKIDSAGLNYSVVNAGLSGETTAGGKSRIGWVLRQPVAVFVLELGGNDGLRGLPLAATRQNLQAIMDTVRQKSPQATIVLAGMQIPPNMGTTYTKEFRGLFAELATRNKAVLIPFLLEGVGGIPKLNQPDGIHPTPVGHKIVANTVWEILQPILK